MKKCPKCNKVYDDTWKVCLNCSSPLVEATQEEYDKCVAKESIPIDKVKLQKAIPLLAKSYLLYVVSSILTFLLYFYLRSIEYTKIVFPKLFGILLITGVLVIIIAKILVLIGMGRVWRSLGTHRGDTLALQIFLLLSFADFLWGLVALYDARIALKAKDTGG